MFDFAVIGLGLIGSAAFKYLSQSGKKVIGIGPDEPEEPWSEHGGVFGSHYDQGRITRQLDASPLWAELAIHSIAEYGNIESQSGIQFYHQSGCIFVGNTSDDDYLTKTEQVAQNNNAPYQRYSATAFRDILQLLNFEDGFTVLHEPKYAGYVNPRQLVEAQLKIAQKRGGDYLGETAVSITTHPNHIQIKTDKGTEIQTKKLLVSAGGWTQFLLGQELGLVPKLRTILLARLDAQEAERLKEVPSIIYKGETVNPAIDGFYSLPPIRYPDGHIYLKIGSGLKELPVVHSQKELNAWFQGDGSKIEAEGLQAELFKVVNDLKAESIHVKPCVTTYTQSNEPILEELETNLFVAAGGCGAAAKSSNEIGRRAAMMLVD